MFDSGHYYCYRKITTDNKTLWANFNDTSVKTINEKEVTNCLAYMAFYQQTQWMNQNKHIYTNCI